MKYYDLATFFLKDRKRDINIIYIEREEKRGSNIVKKIIPIYQFLSIVITVFNLQIRNFFFKFDKFRNTSFLFLI